MSEEPCSGHYLFDWKCDSCKNNYRKAKYHEEKNEAKYCKACKKYVMRVTYKQHKRSKIHQALREVLRQAAH